MIAPVSEEPETEKLVLLDAFGKVAERAERVPEPALIFGPPVTVLDAMALFCATAPGLLKVMFPL